MYGPWASADPLISGADVAPAGLAKGPGTEVPGPSPPSVAPRNQLPVAVLDAAFATATLEQWRHRFAEFNGCWGPMLTPAEVHQHPQSAPNGFLTDHLTNTGFELKLVAPPMHFDETPTQSSGPAPELGQHTELVLLELGYDWNDITQLTDDGVIGPA